MIEIDGFWWFVAALFICGVHALHLCGWRRDQREYMKWRESYNAQEQKRHDEFMQALNTNRRFEWISTRSERGQA